MDYYKVFSVDRNKSYIDFINANRYNKNTTISTPFHKAIRVVQCDQTSSSYPLRAIERTLETFVYPYYTNTHSNNALGRYMAKLVEHATKIIHKSVGAGEDDVVIFTGSGASGAVNHLIHLIKPDLVKSVVFVSELEHYSNYLGWYHYAKRLVVVPSDANGLIDVVELEKLLKRYTRQYPKSFVSMTSCSNITGTLQPVEDISRLAHKYGAKVFFDYATSAPYVNINMHSRGSDMDAIFFSAHKFPGAQSSPGILVINRRLVCTDVPFTPNGGTVRFVSKGTCPVYSTNLSKREMGGTPNIIGIIRTGIAVSIQQAYIDYIYDHELQLTRLFSKGLLRLCAQYPQLRCLVPVNNALRLPIFSIQIKPFHYNFVVVLLSDIFGITTRGGVNCSGILAEKLLKLNPKQTELIRDSIVKGKGVPREYGWVRITLTSYHTVSDIKKILKAIRFVITQGERYMSLYKYNPESNVFSVV
ncbi:aminotransferase class V-fold PLP-dependent enzyme [bacterium]|nr:aminotransferase class V-fold PLP-dependent enzyme [bacterium]NDC93924.1 aminotransferase class V-fold PLP-dependent enzyme [bacterium]NDD83243.1 aminotransferase class V-fold PLP-dependent enzyme [bacterium]NDG28901.1 aminotransferase class V-fold PLP-dependent enzyme [bacterium]